MFSPRLLTEGCHNARLELSLSVDERKALVGNRCPHGKRMISVVGRKLISSWRADVRGVAAMEFGFVALPFFGIPVPIFQIGLVTCAERTRDGCRKIGRGNC